MMLNRYIKIVSRFFLKVKNLLVFKSTKIHVDKTAIFEKGENVRLNNVSIRLYGKSRLCLMDNVSISDYDIVLHDSDLIIGTHCILDKGNSTNKPNILISQGSCLDISNNNLIRSSFWIRFGGRCEIGQYNGICEDTEIRCDESILIGNFNMISYQCMIYDTNTHNIYPKDKRRLMTIKDFPNIGKEIERPRTAPVVIGNDCWLGKRAVVLKGTIVESEVVVATNAVVSNLQVPNGSIAVGNPAIIKVKA